MLTDDELRTLIDDFVSAAVRAEKAGFTFVDIKHCHGYLGHELLSGVDRSGQFGGSFENRTRFLREIVAGIRASAPSLKLAVRVSIFDFVPFGPGEDRIGVPEPESDCRLTFGGDGNGRGINFDEPSKFMKLLKNWASDWFARPPAARITIRTFNDRHISLRAMVTSRPKIHWSAWLAKSGRRRSSNSDIQI